MTRIYGCKARLSRNKFMPLALRRNRQCGALKGGARILRAPLRILREGFVKWSAAARPVVRRDKSGRADALRHHLVLPQDAEGGTLEACAPRFC